MAATKSRNPFFNPWMIGFDIVLVAGLLIWGSLKLGSRYYLNQAEQQVSQGNYPAAVASYQWAVRLDGGNAKAHYGLGQEKIRGGNFSEALTHFQEATQNDPQLVEAYLRQAALLYANNDQAGAIKALNQVIELDPNNANAFFDRGNAKLAQGDRQGAAVDFERALNLAEKNGPILVRNDAQRILAQLQKMPLKP